MNDLSLLLLCIFVTIVSSKLQHFNDHQCNQIFVFYSYKFIPIQLSGCTAIPSIGINACCETNVKNTNYYFSAKSKIWYTTYLHKTFLIFLF